ncbi:DegV family protein [Brevibacterium sp. 50QC2O2]|jgi:DegV family protein with EDD domain|uniref:DegV family protein n=1 Tax=Brevibacterium TaxID=1696 RepID=UPI00211C20CF|nr:MULTISPECIES: DegV family protein [unclassified Brevibacterium]MCQ9366941.1 DegV family protein [Brevibacterium sp. 91QC2O2]MCQ9384091.1 DegV family protein [Brevibacterium sp. 68QC2CO]MCQ9388431.1 DegV family protein [Brevibacterium sp. 50QC2O2]
MQKLGLVVDSTARLSEEQVETFTAELDGRLRIVDLTVAVAGVERPDRQWSAHDITTAMASGARVTTSQPPAAAFAQAYRELVRAGSEAIVVLTLSARLSGTHTAASSTTGAAGEVPVVVVDSQTAAAGLAGAVAIAVAGRHTGASVLERTLRDWCAEETSAYFVPASLEYLRAGGRIGRAASLLGRALSIVPVLTLDAGEVTPLARVRTSSRAIARLVDSAVGRARELAAGGGRIECVLLHAEASAAEAGAGFTRLRELVDEAELPTGTRVREEILSTVITAHVGPGTTGIIVQTLP